jgi:hypothetical protein
MGGALMLDGVVDHAVSALWLLTYAGSFGAHLGKRDDPLPHKIRVIFLVID